MRKFLALLLSVLALAVIMTGCSGGSGTPQSTDGSKENSTPADLTGNWKQVDGNSETSYQVAVITADAITVYWMSADSQSLYWAGSFVAPTTATEPYKWTSNNDHDKTGSAMLASSDETKEFTYKNGQIS